MKGRMVVNLLLLVLLAVLIGAHWLVLPDPSRRNDELMPDMVVSVAHDAQFPAPVLSDGTLVDLRPPEGSVVRGLPPFDYAADPDGARLAGQELAGPEWGEDEEADVVARGAFIFASFCAVCHGAGGLGDGPVTKRGVPPPPSLLADHARQMPDGEIYHLLTLGRGNMASYAAQVRRDDRWKVIRYIRSLQKPPEAPPSEETPAAAEGMSDPGPPGPAPAESPKTEGQEP